jgi:hypothetical protein
MGGKAAANDPRFVVEHEGLAGDEDRLRLLPRVSDGQLLFLVNKLSKMKDTPLGSRIADVHNGSALFTGEAGSGESNVRRWIIESDWLEAIVALPLNIFYNTGIATYVWVLSNRKAEVRGGKDQLLRQVASFALLFLAFQLVHRIDRIVEADTFAAVDGGHAESRRDMRLARPGPAHKDQVVRGFHECRAGQLLDLRLRQGRFAQSIPVRSRCTGNLAALS